MAFLFLRVEWKCNIGGNEKYIEIIRTDNLARFPNPPWVTHVLLEVTFRFM